MAAPDRGVADYSARKVQALHTMLMSDKPNIEAVRKHNLEDTALEYLDVFFGIAVGAEESSEEARSQARDLIGLMGLHAHPREMLLAIGEQVEKVADDLDAIEPEADEEMEDGEGGPSQPTPAVPHTSPTARLASRWLLVLQCYTAVIPRLNAKAANKTIGEIVSGLSDALDDLLEARMFGVEMNGEETHSVVRAMSELVRAAAGWSQGKQGEEEARAMLAQLFCKLLVLAQDKLECPLLEVWFTEHHADRLPSNKGKAKLQEDQTTTMESIVATLSALQLDIPALVRIVTSASPPPDNPPLPISALLAVGYLLTSSSARQIELDDPLGSLRSTMPLLGSALNGLCVQAGLTWTAELVLRISGDWPNPGRGHSGRLDSETASVLVELIMPNMAGDPSELSRFAQHRLLAGIIATVSDITAKVALYEQMISSSNPFENVRVSALALLREDVAQSLAARPGILGGDAENLLKTAVFVMPESDPPLQTSSLSDIADTAWPAWLAEAANLLFLLLSASGDPLNLKAGSNRKVLDDRFVAPLTATIQRWEAEAGERANEHDSLRLQATLFGISETLARISALAT